MSGRRIRPPVLARESFCQHHSRAAESHFFPPSFSAPCPENSKVKHLRFEDMSPSSLKASWDPADGNVLGYRVRCRRQAGPSTLLSVSPQVHSVLLSDLVAGSTNKVCVKPVYKNLLGKGLCRMAHLRPGKLWAEASRRSLHVENKGGGERPRKGTLVGLPMASSGFLLALPLLSSCTEGL